MGCAQSNEDGEGPVARCRERKHLLRDAVAARHALAGAHAGHAAALKNVGAALSDYASGEGEAHAGGALRSGSLFDSMPPPTLDTAAAEPSSSASAERREPPPPAPDEHQPSAAAREVAEGKRPAAAEAATTRRAMTQKAARKGKAKAVMLVAPPQPQPAKLGVGDILRALDEHFLKASQSAHEVSKLLEAARMHYHSNFAETRGFVDHSARVMQVITWNRSFKGIPQPENVRNEMDDDEWETHATTLDKLLAWEKKLYHEVKDFEVIRREYQQKLAVLNKKKQRGVTSSSLEKTKSVVSHLHTKYVVDLQTMESTVAEINRLRDQQLYPKLLELVKGMWHMWDAMYLHHKTQLKIILELKSLDISVAPRETSEQHHDRTVQLWNVVHEWHTQFDKFMTYQKQYVGSLYTWIKLNVIPIDTNLKPNSSQPHETTPPIKRVLHAWHEILGKLPDEAAKKAINTFAEIVKTILVHQEDELKLRMKIEDTRRDYGKKRRQFDDWAQKYIHQTAGILPEDRNPDGARPDPMAERKAAMEKLELSMKELEEMYVKQCRVVREKSLSLLRTNLPELFRVVSDFSLQSAGMFKGVWSIAHTNDQLDE
ncbi:hypothetical protein OsI_25359 [Oryza sativa Indica Group]|uniref:DUF632 domain-containing protein n=1 Tax=Oryza sativa subsp. indica TaxID=39946 RepID=A2YJE8_ORYSI|nr:hypothetical protein OsI_25359 [Oryza sativa Indica Group]